MLSIIIPTYNEAGCIVDCLKALQRFRALGVQIIVADGGSQDNTSKLVSNMADHLILSSKGRAIQMNRGARLATGAWLLFLHADTSLPNTLPKLLQHPPHKKNTWGWFHICLSDRRFAFRIIETLMRYRSKLTAVGTGDQTLFISTALFRSIGGFPEIDLMEDIAICKKLRTISKPVCLDSNVVSSVRRWQQNGILRTILKMWVLRLLYFCGVNPRLLAKIY